MINYEIKFIKDNQYTSIRLYSHYTCIMGKYSGEGKSEFLADVIDGLSDGTVRIDSELPVHIIDVHNLPLVLDLKERCIIIVDELAMLRSNLIKEINKSPHLFLGISRGNPLHLDCPLQGIYTVERTDDWFQIKSLENELPRVSDCKDCRVIMESKQGKSEHELLSKYFANCTPAGGRDNIHKYLITNQEMMVFTDLGAIGKAFMLLRKRCRDNPNIKFYDYMSFEHLLIESPLLRNKINNKSVFDYTTFERYFEDILEDSLKKFRISYRHGSPLPEFILNASVELLFNSDVGKPLFKYIRNRNTLFDKEEYLKEYQGIPQASIDACETKEDCDALLKRLGLKF